MLKFVEYVCLVFFGAIFFAHIAISPSVSVTTFKDADALYSQVKSNITPFFSVTEADIQPGFVFITSHRLVDGITWGMAPTMLVAQNSI
jgi:hypothetical protein